MKWLWDLALSLLPTLDWKGVLERHGLAAVISGALLYFCGYELAIPIRDEVLATSREMRVNFRDLTQAKLADSVSFAKLVRLLELRELEQPDHPRREALP